MKKVVLLFILLFSLCRKLMLKSSILFLGLA